MRTLWGLRAGEDDGAVDQFGVGPDDAGGRYRLGDSGGDRIDDTVAAVEDAAGKGDLGGVGSHAELAGDGNSQQGELAGGAIKQLRGDSVILLGGFEDEPGEAGDFVAVAPARVDGVGDLCGGSRR